MQASVLTVLSQVSINLLPLHFLLPVPSHSRVRMLVFLLPLSGSIHIPIILSEIEMGGWW